MFIETHKAVQNDDLYLTFLKSLVVQTYPCGRRRSKIERGGTDSPSYLPVDPEARLNTEANNRKYTSLNGFTQTYLNSCSDKVLSLALAGYSFTIDLNSLNTTGNDTAETIVAAFGQKAIEALTGTSTVLDGSKIYANIRMQNVKLFSGSDNNYYTTILRDQTDSVKPRTELDILKYIESATSFDIDDLHNYYFSGLSFSTSPLTEYLNYDEDEYYLESLELGETRNIVNVYKKEINSDIDNLYQQVVSLCILENKEGTWKLYEPARLPHIEHGEEEDSIVLNKVNLNSLTAVDIEVDELKVNTKINAETAEVKTKTLYQNGNQVPMLEMTEQTDGTWRMNFSTAVKVEAVK